MTTSKQLAAARIVARKLNGIQLPPELEKDFHMMGQMELRAFGVAVVQHLQELYLRIDELEERLEQYEDKKKHDGT